MELHAATLAPPSMLMLAPAPSPMVQDIALPVPDVPKASYALKVAAPHVCPPPALATLPNKPRLWATIKGTRNT